MRIVQLTPGTGSFHCGTCMRDNGLVVELRRQGHEAVMAPLYLPPTLDEASTAEGVPLFYGGVNVYLQQKSAIFRHTPRWLDKVLDAPKLLLAAGKRAGMTSARELGELTLSMLRGEEGKQAKELDRLLDWLAAEMNPEVVCLSQSLLIGMARRIRQRTNAAIVCTLQGEDSFLDSLPGTMSREAWDILSERAADVDAFIAPSQYYADLMRTRARLPVERVHVVSNGINLEGYSAVERVPNPPVLGYLARLSPVKGLDQLVEAFVLLRARGRVANLKLRVAGTQTDADLPFVERMKARLAEKGLLGEAEFLPNLDRAEKIGYLQSLSVLSVPVLYGESFGLYVIEALAAGVPVVQPRHGAFPELVEATGGGVVCEPGDPVALAEAIEALLLDPEKRARHATAGRRAVLENFSVERMAQGVLRVFEHARRHRAAEKVG